MSSSSGSYPRSRPFRAHRFTVGERLSTTGLDLLTTLVEAAYTRNKDALLDAANRKVNAIRYLLRLAKDLKLMNIDAYGFSPQHFDEIGRKSCTLRCGYAVVLS